MYAVIKSGGKQYKVSQGDTIKVEKLPATEGDKFDITDVLMVADGENVTVGTPLVEGAAVSAEVLSHGRGPKVKIIKFKRRKQYRRQAGHRQAFTELAITGIKAN
jgi:large subunit ribosomal protein L21